MPTNSIQNQTQALPQPYLQAVSSLWTLHIPNLVSSLSLPLFHSSYEIDLQVPLSLLFNISWICSFHLLTSTSLTHSNPTPHVYYHKNHITELSESTLCPHYPDCSPLPRLLSTLHPEESSWNENLNMTLPPPPACLSLEYFSGFPLHLEKDGDLKFSLHGFKWSDA